MKIEPMVEAMKAEGLNARAHNGTGPTDIEVIVPGGIVLLALEFNRQDGWEAAYEDRPLTRDQVSLYPDGPSSSASAEEVAEWAVQLVNSLVG